VPSATAPLARVYAGEFVEENTILLTPILDVRPPIRLLRVDNSMRPGLADSRWSGQDAARRPWTIDFKTDQNNEDGTQIVTGTDLLGGVAGSLTGYATMDRLEISLRRGTVTTPLSARLGPAVPSPRTAGPRVFPRSMTFTDGSVLTRTSPVPI
jgi:hypothetical protein